MFQSRSKTNMNILVLGAGAFLGVASAAAATSPTTPTMQVYHECTESVYCKYFALTGKSTPWELVPSHKVTSYDYPTEQYNATVWCSKTPDEAAYSWMKLSLDESSADPAAGSVTYSYGSYGNDDGIRTQPPFQQGGFSIGPDDAVQTNAGPAACQKINCEAGTPACSNGASGIGPYSCTQGNTIRWTMCAGSLSNSTDTNEVVVRDNYRAARFVA